MNYVNFLDKSASCELGTVFAEGHIGLLREFSFYMNTFVLATMAGKLSFEGSNDNFATVTSILTVGQEIHEGWNYYNFDTLQTFRYYRLKGTTVGSCRVAKIHFRGTEVIADSNPTYACSVSLTV
jgi:hypothetical protein